MAKCKIQWVDKQGNPTPDSNDAIQLVRTKKRISYMGDIQIEASDWFPICAEHSKRLDDAGMHIWETKPLEE